MVGLALPGPSPGGKETCRDRSRSGQGTLSPEALNTFPPKYQGWRVDMDGQWPCPWPNTPLGSGQLAAHGGQKCGSSLALISVCAFLKKAPS